MHNIGVQDLGTMYKLALDGVAESTMAVAVDLRLEIIEPFDHCRIATRLMRGAVEV